MNILSLENVSKNFGFRPLFTGVSLGLEESERVGLIGANGSGKTTLLRIIAGQEKPDTGRVVVASNRIVSFLPQNPVFDPDQTVLDSVFEASTSTMALLREYEVACARLAQSGGAAEALLARVADLAHQLEISGGWELETNARMVLTELGIDDTAATLGKLSGGQRKRVALAHALVTRPDLLILDEPTNHLDADRIIWLETYLARYNGALLLVTHDRYFLDRVTQRILEIDHGAIQSYAGNYAYYLEKKADLEIERAAAERKRDSWLRRELSWLQQGARARSTKEKARVDRVHAMMEQPKEEAPAQLEITAGFQRMGGEILELHEVSKAYDGKPLIEKFSYKLKRGDRIGIVGPNGVGKTTLLDIITGRVQPDHGQVEIGQTIVIGYYDQESRALNDEQRVIDYIKEVGDLVHTIDGGVITASQMLERFLFPAAMQYAPVGKLSGGERRRLYLLRLLMSSPNLLLLDEPTNDLDISTLIRLEEYLDGFAGCLIVVSHDRYFLDRTVDHIFRFGGAGRIDEYPGNYSQYLELTGRTGAPSGADSVAKVAKQRPLESAPPKPVGPRKLTSKEKRELEGLEAAIAADEARKAEIEQRLISEGSDFSVVQALYSEQQELKTRLDRNVERWAELAELA